MDQVGREERGTALLVTDRTRRLLKPTRFDPPTLTPIATARDIADQHADQLAAAMAVAREEGLRAARSEVQAAIAAQQAASRGLEAAAAALRRAVDELERRDGDTIEGVQEQAVMFAVSLAEELVGRELRSCDDLAIAAVERAMTLTPDRGEVVLRLNAADLTVVQEFTDAVPSVAGRVVLVADVAVERGGCIAVVGPLRIDAQLTPALDRVRAQLRS